MRKQYITLEVTAHNETADAFCCSFVWEECEFVASEAWIPKTQIHDSDLSEIDEAVEGEVIEINVTRWWLNKKVEEI